MGATETRAEQLLALAGIGLDGLLAAQKLCESFPVSFLFVALAGMIISTTSLLGLSPDSVRTFTCLGMDVIAASSSRSLQHNLEIASHEH